MRSSGYKQPGTISRLFPLNRRRWLPADVIHYPRNAIYFVDDAVRDAA